MPKLSQTLECAFDKQNICFKILTLPSGYFNRYTAKNPVISPDFLVWKFCGKAQFPHNFGLFARFHTRKLGEITEFFDVIAQFFSINLQIAAVKIILNNSMALQYHVFKESAVTSVIFIFHSYILPGINSKYMILFITSDMPQSI